MNSSFARDQLTFTHPAMDSHYYSLILFIIYFMGSIVSTVLSQEDSSEVEYFPRISFISKPQVKNAGETAYFSCSVKSAGQNVVEWIRVSPPAGPGQEEQVILIIRNGTLVHQDDEPGRINVRNVGNYHTFQIKDLRPSDAGTYHCALTHNVGATTDLSVRSAPVFLKRDYDGPYLLLGEGESRNLTCFAHGFPTPDIYWTRSENISVESIIATGNVFPIRYVDRKSTRGRYYCLAQNSLGGVRRSIDVEVSFVPRISIPRPIFGATAGHDTSLECLASGVPPPRVTWTKGTTVIENDQHYTLYSVRSGEDNLTNATLSIRSIRDGHFGVYTCKAENVLGSREERVSVLQNVFQVYRGSIGSDGKSETFPVAYGLTHAYAHAPVKNEPKVQVPAVVAEAETTPQPAPSTIFVSVPTESTSSTSLPFPTPFPTQSQSQSQITPNGNPKLRKVLKLVGRRRKIAIANPDSV